MYTKIEQCLLQNDVAASRLAIEHRTDSHYDSIVGSSCMLSGSFRIEIVSQLFILKKRTTLSVENKAQSYFSVEKGLARYSCLFFSGVVGSEQ